MVREILQRWLGPPKQAPTPFALDERMDVLERKLKRLTDEMDGAVELVKLEVKRMQALNGRVTRMVVEREKPAQDALGTTIATPDGVHDPRQLPIPLEVQAARIRAARSREISAGGAH